MGDGGERGRLFKIVGGALAGTSTALAVAYYANLLVSDTSRSFWIPATYACAVGVVVGAVLYMVGEFGTPRRPRWTRRSPPAAATPPAAKPEPEWITLHPMVVGGQLRATMRHRTTDDRHHPFLVVCEVEVSGPEGTFQQTRSSLGSGFHNGVYIVQYPSDFGRSVLVPGRYVIRWFGRNITGRTDEDGKMLLTDRAQVAETVVMVAADGHVGMG